MPMKIAGILAAIFSIGGLASTPVFGIVMLLAAGGLISYQSGIEVDIVSKRYRYITSFGAVGFGEWLALPELKCVSVFKTKLISRTYGRSNASFTSKQEVVQVNLVSARNERFKLLEVENLDEAIS